MTEADLSLDVVMSRRFELVEAQGVLSSTHKAEMEPIATELGLCETFIKSHMLDAGLTQVKTAAGMTYFTTKDSVVVKDMDSVVRFMVAAAPPMPGYTPEQWQQVQDHIALTGMWGLLNKVVNKTATKELIEAKKPPPGVEYSAYKDLAWRKGKVE